MEFFIIAALIISNGILAMSEIALVSLRKSNLASDAKGGSKSAKEALALAESPDRFFSTVQIGITLIGILTGIYSGEAIAGKFGECLASAGVPQKWATLGAQGTVVLAADIRGTRAKEDRAGGSRKGRKARRRPHDAALKGDGAVRVDSKQVEHRRSETHGHKPG